MHLELSQEDREDLIHGLQMRICVIETGKPSLRASDAISMGEPKLVRALSEDQRALIARHEALVKKLRQAR